MTNQCIAGACLGSTGFSYTLSLINGKYKMNILYALMEFQVVRFNEMKKYIGTISYKTLSSSLKELEADGLVHREEYPQIPPKVEYSLTERGRSLIPILDAMCVWGEKNRQSQKGDGVTRLPSAVKRLTYPSRTSLACSGRKQPFRSYLLYPL